MVNATFYIRIIVVWIIFLVLVWQCANPIPLDGGAKDTNPPRLLAEGSTQSGQTNFEKQPITFQFDEWVRVEDVFNQVMVSPPLQYAPTVKAKGKEVLFEFDEREVLLLDATYTINFGESIRDLTESNSDPDFKFVFATGDVLDSLSVRGKVVDAITGEGLETVFVLLYDNLNDTAFTSIRPFYYARTNKEGQFKIENIRADTFQLYALKDLNLNYFYDQAGEQIAFYDDLVYLTDSSSANFSLKLFEEAAPLQFASLDTSNKILAKLIFNQKPDQLDYQIEDKGQVYEVEFDEDSLKLRHYAVDTIFWSMFLKSTEDTLLMRSMPAPDVNLKSTSKLLAKSRKKWNTHYPIEIEWPHPISIEDSSGIYMYSDSLKVELNCKSYVEGRRSYHSVVDIPLSSYMLYILPGTIKDYFGRTNKDTIRQTYFADDKENYGTINLTLGGLDKRKAYIIELRNKGDKLIDEFFVLDEEAFTISKKGINPNVYKLVIIEDVNKNRKWDPGQLEGRIPPERLMHKELEQLRANWDLEVEIIIDEDSFK